MLGEVNAAPYEQSVFQQGSRATGRHPLGCRCRGPAPLQPSRSQRRVRSSSQTHRESWQTAQPWVTIAAALPGSWRSSRALASRSALEYRPGHRPQSCATSSAAACPCVRPRSTTATRLLPQSRYLPRDAVSSGYAAGWRLTNRLLLPGLRSRWPSDRHKRFCGVTHARPRKTCRRSRPPPGCADPVTPHHRSCKGRDRRDMLAVKLETRTEKGSRCPVRTNRLRLAKSGA